MELKSPFSNYLDRAATAHPTLPDPVSVTTATAIMGIHLSRGEPLALSAGAAQESKPMGNSQMPTKTLAEKLKIKPGMRVLIFNAPDSFVEQLGPLPEKVEVVNQADGNFEPESFDMVHLFAQSISELERLALKAISAVKYDQPLWISYPKMSGKIDTDINRDKGWDVVTHAGLKGVAQISIDDTWSALRFRPEERVGK